MAYRATPLVNVYSPEQLLFIKNLKTTLPTTPTHLISKSTDRDMIQASSEKLRQTSKKTYDSRHRGRLSTVFNSPDTQVFVRNMDTQGVVQEKLSEPRSYLVSSPKEVLRRNRKYLLTCDDRKTIDDPPDQGITPVSNDETNTRKSIDHSRESLVEKSPKPSQPERSKGGKAYHKTPM